MLEQAGLLQALIDVDEQGQPAGYLLRSPTWEGFDFLDATRDAGVWEQVKEKARAAGSWTVSTLIEIGKSIAKGKVREMMPGLEL